MHAIWLRSYHQLLNHRRAGGLELVRRVWGKGDIKVRSTADVLRWLMDRLAR